MPSMTRLFNLEAVMDQSWIKKVPELKSGVPTIASETPVSGASRDKFWSAMSAAVNDPYFEVTVSESYVSIRQPQVRARA